MLHLKHQNHTSDQENFFSTVYSRKSVRAYFNQPMPQEAIAKAISATLAAPSNCNVQPWKIFVLSGASKQSLSDKLITAIKAREPANRDFEPADYKKVAEFRKRQIDCAVAMYGKMGIGRDDTQGRMRAALRNYEFFGAPHVAYFTMNEIFGATVAVDMGMAAQNFMLALNAMGAASCPQGALRDYPHIVREHLQLTDDNKILFGVSFGYEDTSQVVNETDPGRENMETLVTFLE